jgi:hypothetical protein
VARLLATIRTRILRLLRRRGVLAAEDAAGVEADPLAADAPVLAQLSAAAVRGRSAFGDRAGTPVLRVGHAPDAPWVWTVGPRHAHLERFDLHADRAVRADDRAGLERLARYLLRPPLAQERLARLATSASRAGVLLYPDGYATLDVGPAPAVVDRLKRLDRLPKAA